MSDEAPEGSAIRAIDRSTVHKITSGQVVVDLQTAVKELVENSLDAGATNIEIRFKEYGLRSIEVIDNGSGISKENYESVALKHYTSKLSKYEDLTTVRSFGFRGEALSSLCALSDSVTFTTATEADAPMGTILEMERSGKLKHSNGKAARSRGTTASVSGLFTPLPVRRKEWERNAKREFAKALTLITAYALVPCAQENQGVRLLVYNHPENGKRTVQFRTDGSASVRSSVSALWGPKQLDPLVPLDLTLEVQREKASLKRIGDLDTSITVQVSGLISKFSFGSGRTGTDRQFFYVNGRPCNLGKVQKAFNEVYRTFNSNQSPFIIADFKLPTEVCDINVSPDKRTIFVHSEDNLIIALKEALESAFSPERSTFSVAQAQIKPKRQQDRKIEPDAINEHMEVDTGVDQQMEGEKISNDVFGPSATRGHREIRTASTSSCRASSKDAQDHSESTSTNPLTDIETESDPPNQHVASTSIGLTDLPPSSADTDMRSQDPEPITPSKPVSSRTGRPAPDNHDLAEFTQVLSPIGTRKSYIVSPENPQDIPQLKKPIQAVLSTSGASWNLRRQSDDGDGSTGSRKRLKLQPTAPASLPLKSDFKTRLSSYAAAGSQVTHSADLEEEDDDNDNDEDKDEGEDKDAGPEEDVDEVDEVEDESNQEIPLRPVGTARHEENEDKDRKSQVNQRYSSSLAMDPVRDLGTSTTVRPRSYIRTSPPNRITASSSPLDPVVDLTVNEPDEDIPPEESDPLGVDAALSSSGSGTRTLSDTGGDNTLRVDLARISSVWEDRHSTPTQAPSPISVSVGAAASNANNDGSAERELSRVISKEDFNAMEIIGQFNKGFIVARLRKRHGAPKADHRSEQQGILDDLFLIDQHAADEKYNFEDLQVTTKIQSQQLFKPRPLELNAADEMIARESVDILRINGFEIMIKGDEDNDEERERVYLMAQPVSKSTVFDMKDLEELLHLLQSAPSGQMVRCSKARAMFASRACRKSVMIGNALSMRQMTAVSYLDALYVGMELNTFATLDRSAYGDHGPAVELPTRPPDNAAS
ncbi:hypothetical protein FRB93_011210 [Tulasnella sp. JGI-2019a]|nr:hypothetical protein FRB93_011210 [Tulasnella sp. JGI-2019a]